MWQPSYSVVLGFPHLYSPPYAQPRALFILKHFCSAQDLAANVAMIESGKVKIQINKVSLWVRSRCKSIAGSHPPLFRNSPCPTSMQRLSNKRPIDLLAKTF
jgi:hypothetical protein